MLEILQEDIGGMNLSVSAPLLLMGKLETAREVSTIKEGIPSARQLHLMGGLLKVNTHECLHILAHSFYHP